MTEIYSPAPYPTHRLIPSRFPPVGLFDTVATAADLKAVMDLVGWTNDRLVAERLARLPEQEWIYGRTNASIVMAAFLHVAPSGMRFNGADLGAWYASAEIKTAAVEVAHHLRREAIAGGVPTLVRVYREYQARLQGEYLDIRDAAAVNPDILAADRHDRSQVFGESVRSSGKAGILYNSVRFHTGINIVAYRPTNVLEVMQSNHFEIHVQSASRRIEIKRLNAL